MAPLSYEPEIRAKKRNFSTTTTKDLEKRKKAAAHAAEQEDETLGNAIPTKR